MLFRSTLECMEPTVLNWSEAVISQIKEQLNKANGGRNKNFNYGLILISFSLEWIRLMQPQHVVLGVSNPRDSRMQRWVELMGRHVGQSTIVFSTAFFTWFRRQVVSTDEYAYIGADFRGDPDLALSEVAQWCAIGKNVLTMFFIFIRFCTMFFYFLCFPKTKLKF